MHDLQSALYGIYLPSSSIKLGRNTQHLFNHLPETTAEPLNVVKLREAVAEWDRTAAFGYPHTVAMSDFKEVTFPLPAAVYRAPHASPETKTLVFIHGGGFFCELTNVHKSLLANIAAKAGCHCVLPHYSLAPEHPAPAAIEEVTELLKNLILNPEHYELTNKIILVGYSSGGNLAWNALLNLFNEVVIPQDRVRRCIERLILISPWADVSMQTTKLPFYQKQQDTDKMLQTAGLEQMRNWYLPHVAKQDDPKFSPLYRPAADMRLFPPVSVIVGQFDRLLTDSIRSVAVLKEAGVATQLIILEGQTHNHSAHVGLRDGVFTGDIISAILNRESLLALVVSDGFKLLIKNYNGYLE